MAYLMRGEFHTYMCGGSRKFDQCKPAPKEPRARERVFLKSVT